MTIWIQRPGTRVMHHGAGLAFRSMGQNAAVATYAEILRDTYGADEVWPLVDIAAGTDIPAFVNANRNGTLTGWDLQNAAGPVTGTLAPYSDGANDYGNILTDTGTTGLKQIFDGDEGSVFGWARVDGDAVWDGTGRVFRIQVDSSNAIMVDINPTSLRFFYRAGGTIDTFDYDASRDTDWFSYGLSWSASAGATGEMKGFFNGAQVGTTQVGLGVWAGSIGMALIGALAATPANVWDGLLAYFAVKCGSIWSPADFAAMHAAAATAGAD